MSYGTYWLQRISASIVAADARRCLRRLPGLARAALEGVAAPGAAGVRRERVTRGMRPRARDTPS